MLRAFWILLKRDLLLALRRRSEIFTVLFFFLIVISLFPLGVGSEDATLKKIAPGVVWIAALLASTLALDRLFSNDYLDGTLEQLTLAPQSLSIMVSVRFTICHEPAAPCCKTSTMVLASIPSALARVMASDSV